MPKPSQSTFDDQSVLIARLITELAHHGKQPVTAELFSPPRKCRSCHREDHVLVEPQQICGHCWLRSLMQAEVKRTA